VITKFFCDYFLKKGL